LSRKLFCEERQEQVIFTLSNSGIAAIVDRIRRHQTASADGEMDKKTAALGLPFYV
jgi:hypothetical protein